MKRFTTSLSSLILLTVLATAAQADVSIETVPVGNLGNAGEWSRDAEYNLDRITGAVNYAYNIGKYEVTAGQYCRFLNVVAKTDTYGLYNSYMSSIHMMGCRITQDGSSGNYSYSVADDWANRPVNYISWGDAARFANWLHNGQQAGSQDDSTTENGSYDLDGATSDAALMAIMRKSDATWVIPTEDEWYKAAYHKNDGDTDNYFDYPTSSNSTPGCVNSGKLSGTGTAFTENGTDPGNYATYDGDGGTNGIGYPYYRSKVGEWENSSSPYGTFDQGGNVLEWNEADLIPGMYRAMRGGWFGYYGDDLQASYRNHGRAPTDERYSVGFRVAEVLPVPEPGGAALLICGLASLICRRRRK